MTRLFVQLGSNIELSSTELKALLQGSFPVSISISDHSIEEVVTLEVDSTDHDIVNECAELLQKRAGGIVKILVERADMGPVEREDDVTTDQLENAIGEYIITSDRDPDERITFAVAKLGFHHLATPSPMQVKKVLRKEKIKTRFIEGPAEGLSAAVLLHEDVQEFIGLFLQDRVIIAETLTVQDIDNWTHRDRKKPYAERRRGMLPPKLARIMTNIGLSDMQTELEDSSTPYLLDPFCGSGTVSMEALLRDADIAASDLDKKAVQGTKQNISWLQEEYPETANYTADIFVEDATHINIEHLTRKVDTIVTEPYLGKLTPKEEDAPNILKGIEKLYHGAFKQWRHLLKPGASITIVFPVISYENTEYDLRQFIDKLEER